MIERLNVVCFLWGAWCGGLGPVYVARLLHAVRRNLGVPFEFHVLADERNVKLLSGLLTAGLGGTCEAIRVLEISPPSWLGCLPKLTAYDPDLRLEGPVLVLDLDSIIIGPLDPFVAVIDGSRLITRAWFVGMRRGLWLSGGDMLGFRAGWEPGTELWRAFAADPVRFETIISEGGRERYVYRKLLAPAEIDYWQRLLPGAVLSYKHHCKGTGTAPDGAAIVSCHGHPRPHEVKEEWLKRCWE